MCSLNIDGFVKMSTVDYPDNLSAVIFLKGCTWKCSYCHNQHLQEMGNGKYNWITITEFLEIRKNKLDAIVFSGGEPTMHSDILQAIKRVKGMGFKAALHTAGIYPDRLKVLLPYLDWVGLDIKHLPEKYSDITGVPFSEISVMQSISYLKDSGVEYECRTTINPDIITVEEIIEIAERLANFGVKNYALQIDRPIGLVGVRGKLEKLFDSFEIRE